MGVSQDDWIMPEALEVPIPQEGPVKDLDSEEESVSDGKPLLNQYTHTKNAPIPPHNGPVTLSKIQQFVEARSRYNEQLLDFFNTVTRLEREDFFSKILKQRSFAKGEAPLLKDLQENFSKAVAGNVEIQKQGLLLLNQGNVEAAFLYFYLVKGKIVEAKDAARGKKKLIYDYKKNVTELKTIEWLVENLRQLCPSSFVNTFMQKNTAKNQTEDYHLEDNAQKLFVKMQQAKLGIDAICKLLIDPKTSPFPIQYGEMALARRNKISEAYLSAVKEILELSKVQEKGETVFNDAKHAMVTLATRCRLMAKMHNITHELEVFEKEIREDYEEIKPLKKQILKLEEDIDKIAKEYWEMAIDLMGKMKKEKMDDFFDREDESNFNQKVAEFQYEYRYLIDKKVKPLFEQYSRKNAARIISDMKEVREHLCQIAEYNSEFIKRMQGLLELFKNKRQEQANLQEKNKEKEAAEYVAKVAEYKKKSEEVLRERKAHLEKERAKREKLKLEERKKMLVAKQNLKPSIEPGLPDAMVLFNSKMLEIDEGLLEDIFTKPTPHYKIAYPEVVKLVETLGGSVTAPGRGGSHRSYEIEQGVIEIGSVIGLVDMEEGEETSVGVEKEPGKQAGGLVKPHHKGHNAKKLPGIAVRQFRDTLELVGVTPANLARIKKAVIKPNP